MKLYILEGISELPCMVGTALRYLTGIDRVRSRYKLQLECRHVAKEVAPANSRMTKHGR